MNIDKVKPETSSVTTIVISGEGLEKFKTRKPGQFALLQVPADSDWSVAHPFTISNASQDPFVQMTIKSAGAFTSKIRDLTPGTEVRLQGPFGKFCTGLVSGDKVLMVAGGIGITPFLSVLRSYKNEQPGVMVTVLWGCNTGSDFFALEELAEIAQAGVAKIVLIVGDGSELRTGLSVEQGFITKELIAKYSDLSEKIFVCGPPKMYEFVEKQFEELGVNKSQIQTEKFFWNPPTKKNI